MANHFEANQPNSQHLQSISYETHSVSISLKSRQPLDSDQQLTKVIEELKILQQEVGHLKAQSLNREKRVQSVEERQEDLEVVFSQTVTSAVDREQEIRWKLQMYEDYTNPD
jgi:hypothetical protein